MKNKTAIFILLSILCLTSCRNTKDSEDSRTVFRYNESSGINSLDPAFARDQSIIWACHQLYNGLVQLDDSMNVIPCIAKSWKISEDGKTYTFSLRNDVYFHETDFHDFVSKRKVIANDFIYSFNRIIDEKTASPGAWVFGNVARNENGKLRMEAPNDSTLVIHLNIPFPPFLGILTMQYCSVVPQEVVEKYGKDFRNHPVGTGPFQFQMWKEGVKLVFRKNNHYFEFENETRLPYLDAIAITFIVDKQSAFLEFIKGNLDFLSGIDASYKDELLTSAGKLNPKYHGKFKMLTMPYLNTEYLGFLVDPDIENEKDNPLMIKEVRQAINYGFDRQKMMQFLRNNIGEAAYNGIIPRGLPGFVNDRNYGYNYNPERSRELLTKAGFPGGKGLKPITLSVSASYLDLSQYIQSELSKIGIPLKIEVNPPATQRDLISKSKLPFFRGSWIADYPDAENYLSLFYSPNFTPGGPNYTHYKNKIFDNLYEKSQQTTDDTLRYAMYAKMDSIMMEDAPVVILYYDQVVRLIQNNIEGLGNNSMNLLSLKKVRKLGS